MKENNTQRKIPTDKNDHLRKGNELKAQAEHFTPSQEYETLLSKALIERSDKVEFIENKLEILVEQQINKIKIHTQQKPRNFFIFPEKKRNWKNTLLKQQTILTKLKERLRFVHKIKEKVTHQGPHLEILAQNKLLFQNPSFVNYYIKYKEEERKKKIHQKSNTNQRTLGRTIKRGLKHKLQ